MIVAFIILYLCRYLMTIGKQALCKHLTTETKVFSKYLSTLMNSLFLANKYVQAKQSKAKQLPCNLSQKNDTYKIINQWMLNK